MFTALAELFSDEKGGKWKKSTLENTQGFQFYLQNSQRKQVTEHV